MNKIFTLGFGLMFAAAPCFAQEEDELNETFQFVYADGTVVPNGSTVTVKNYEEKDLLSGKAIMKSGLYVKNTTNQAACLSVKINVQGKPNGDVQLCFPMNCSNYGVGVSETSKGTLKADGTLFDLQTEWMAESYGTAKVSYTILNYSYLGMNGLTPKYEFDGDGPTVTVVYEYSASSTLGISDVNANVAPAAATYFDLQGRKVDAPSKGIYIMKAGGESKKVTIK